MRGQQVRSRSGKLDYIARKQMELWLHGCCERRGSAEEVVQRRRGQELDCGLDLGLNLNLCS